MAEPSSRETSPAGKTSQPHTAANEQQSGDWKRHPKLYMPDGTMVLLANNTLFRVYPGLLSKHSEVFRGMASLSGCQPPNSETYDGCPLVRMTDDPEDLAYFLNATMGLLQWASSHHVASILFTQNSGLSKPINRRHSNVQLQFFDSQQSTW
jgi:hypothetical protein